MPSVLWRSLCSLISHTFTNSRSWSFIIFSFPTQSDSQTSACLLCLLVLGYRWRQYTIPLLKAIHPAPSQLGFRRPEAEGDGLARRGRVPEKPPDSCPASPSGDAPGLHPAQKGHRSRLGWEKTENQDKSRSARTLGVSRPRLCTRQGALQSQTTTLRTPVQGAAVPVAGDGAPAARYRGTADVHTRARLQTQQKCVIYTV